jgi:hypothetical protein
MAKFNLGDEVLVYHPSYRNGVAGTTERTVIAKEGLRYVYLRDRWGELDLKTPFDRETGRKKTSPKAVSHYDPQIWVPAEWEAKEHRAKVCAALREHGVRFERDWLNDRPQWSTETLEKLLAVLDEARAPVTEGQG